MSNTFKIKGSGLFESDHPIPSNGKFYLSDIITDNLYETWFSRAKPAKIFVLNKGRCGNGGTTGFIRYAQKHCKGLTVSVPNRSIVKSKEIQKDLCCVYGGAENIEQEKNIRICTWDKTDSVDKFRKYGFEQIDIEKWINGDVDDRFWSGSLLVVDEYHKLIDDSNYRDICYQMVQKIMTTTNNVVLMSATPNYGFLEFLRAFTGKDVVIYNVEYDDEGWDKQGAVLQWMNRPEGIRTYDIVMEVVESARKKKATYETTTVNKSTFAVNQVCFFYNSVSKISDIVNDMCDVSDVEVLCSKDELNEVTVPCYSEKFNPDKLIHFMTSAYFTGMDVDIPVDKVVIIGGNNIDFLAYSHKSIKQMLGRFRKGYEGSFVISNGRTLNEHIYGDIVGKMTVARKKIKEYKKHIDEEEHINKNITDIVRHSVDYLYYLIQKKSMDGWMDFDAFNEMMEVYKEYKVVEKTLKKPREFKRKKDIPFSVYRKHRLADEKVEYRYAAICEKFIEMFGIEKFKTVKFNDIRRMVELEIAVKDVDVCSLDSNKLYDLLLGDGYYKGAYLMSVLDYLGEKCDYDVLEDKMRDVFGCYCIKQEDGRKKNKKSGLFLCVSMDEFVAENGTFCILGYIYNIYEYTKTEEFSDGRSINGLKVALKVSPNGRRTEAVTTQLDSIRHYSMINDGDEYQSEFFTKINKDISVIPNIKRDAEFKKLFDAYKRNQTMISEFYKDTDTPTARYHFATEEMEKIDCLIVDIDDSISFNEFKSIYSDIRWTAYPTISNYNADNWCKFRVVIPLAQTLLVPNDNLAVLKLLRRMICKHEDRNHGLYSNTSKEQWDLRVSNEGKTVNISQDTVIYLTALLNSMHDAVGMKIERFKKLKKSTKIETLIASSDTKDRLIQSTISMFEGCKVGERNAVIYGRMWYLVVKRGFNAEDIAKIREGLTRQDMIIEMDTVCKQHRWM